jgi:hypothetical protein
MSINKLGAGVSISKWKVALLCGIIAGSLTREQARAAPSVPPGVGPTGPVGPVATSCTGVNLTPGMSIQTAVNNNASGTTFCLAAGTYARQHVIPKSGNKIIGAVGAILDGHNATVRAFDGRAANVVVQNLIIQNYAAGYQDAPIYIVNATGWKVLNNEIRYNAGVGILFKDNVLVQFNDIHHNLEMGFGSDGGVGIVVDSNEIAFNNYTDAFSCDECGGSKLWATEGAQVTHNFSHDNHGPGLWDDFNNNNIVYAYNRIENNHLMGIHHEIGYNASIHDNVITSNGKVGGSTCNWLWCAAISIAASGGVNGGTVEIYNNQITPGSSLGNAIGLIQQNRTNSEASLGPWIVQNVLVHDNYFDMSLGGHTGGVQDMGDLSIFTSRNNLFYHNTYKLGNNTSPFYWMNSQGGKSFWQSFGMDLNGTFIP